MSHKRKPQTPKSPRHNSGYDAPKLNRPRIEVEGSASALHVPECGNVEITLTAVAATPAAAWSLFQERLAALRERLNDIGTFGRVIPSETTADVQKTMRTTTEVTVSASVTVKFAPDKFGHVLKALVEGRYNFGTPTFEFDATPVVTPALLEQATVDARARAEAIAAGLGAQVGRVVDVHIGRARTRTFRLPLFDYLSRDSFATRHDVAFCRTTAAGPSIDPDDYMFDEEDVETHESTAEVTVNFELILPDEVAA